MNDHHDQGVIAATMQACLEQHRVRRALTSGAEALQYAELGERIRAANRVLVMHVGDRPRRHIGYCLANSPDYVILYFAALFAGHVPLLLDANFNTSEIESIRADCGLDALIVEPAKVRQLGITDAGVPASLGHNVVLLPLQQSAPRFRRHETTEVCRFTSGTTGRPKCLEFSGDAVVTAARHWTIGTGLNDTDRTLCLAALSNGLAFNTSLLSTFLVGGELHLLKGLPLTRTVARGIAEQRISRLVAFPAFYRHLVGEEGPAPSHMASLTHAISAGAPLWPDVREAFRHHYGLDVSDYYGIAETGPCTFERHGGHGTGLGEPLPGVEIKIAPGPADVETGEVLVRTASMATGYLNFPELFATRLDAEGFYHSGDRGRLVGGRLHLAGRTRDHINVAGRKVDPTEILDVVSAVDGVQEAVVFPDEDRHRETFVHVVVVAATPALTSATIAEACRSRLASYKVPGLITFVGRIPRNGIGKPRIAALREALWARRDASDAGAATIGTDTAG